MHRSVKGFWLASLPVCLGLAACTINEQRVNLININGVIPAQKVSGVAIPVDSGKRTEVESMFNFRSTTDCTLGDPVIATIDRQPAHGSIEVTHESRKVAVASTSPYAKCNGQDVMGTIVYYNSVPAYIGSDVVNLTFGTLARPRIEPYVILISVVADRGKLTPPGASPTLAQPPAVASPPSVTAKKPAPVQPAPAPVPERPSAPSANALNQLRGATAGEHTLMGAFSVLDRDCANLGAPHFQVATPPRHGHVSIEQGTGFPNYPKDNPRSACNDKRAPQTRIFYQSDKGFTGADLFSVEETTATGGFRHLDYTVNVR